MEELNNISSTLALSMGAAWASGINLYAAMLMLGLMGATGQMDLPLGLEVLSDPLVIGAAGLMYFIEFFVDKTPGVDTIWDGLTPSSAYPPGRCSQLQPSAIPAWRWRFQHHWLAARYPLAAMPPRPVAEH